MAYDQIVKKAANNSYIAEVMLRDSTTGMGKTGVAYGDVSYGYWREGAATGANGTCVTMSKGTYADHGWVEVDATNLPGVYQFGVPDAALATGANAVTVILKTSGAIDARLRILLVDVDLRDTVRMGMTALPNAAAAASGGLPTTNGSKLNQTADLTAGQSIAVSDKTGFALTAAYDAAKTAAQAGDEMDLVDAPNATAVTAIQSGLSTHSAADAATAVWAAGTRTLTSFGTLAADAAAAVWAIATSTLTSAGTIGKLLVDKMGQLLGTIAAGTHNAQSGDAYGVVTNATYGNSAIKTETALIYADTDELQKNQGNWTTATGFATPTNVTDATSPLATSSQAESISQAIDALNDISTSDVQAIIDVIAGATWTDQTLEAIKAAIDAIETGGTPLTAEQTAAAVLDAVASEHNTALSIGQKINAAGSAADPLLNDPADYAEGTAGYALASIDDIKTKTDRITTGTEVTLVSPVTDDGNFTIYAGDDYAADESREISWGPTDIWDALDFAGGTVTLIIYRGDTTLEVEGTAGGTTGAKTVTVEMDADDTAALAGVGAWSYQLHATLDSGSEVTLATGRLTVVDAKQPTAGAE